MKNKLDINYSLSDFEDEEPGNFEGNRQKAHRTQSRNFPSVRLKAQYLVLLGENILNVQSLGYEKKKKKKGKNVLEILTYHPNLSKLYSSETKACTSDLLMDPSYV